MKRHIHNGRKFAPQITEVQALEAAEKALKQKVAIRPTVTIRDICKASKIPYNNSIMYDIRRFILANGYTEIKTTQHRNRYAPPTGAASA